MKDVIEHYLISVADKHKGKEGLTNGGTERVLACL